MTIYLIYSTGNGEIILAFKNRKEAEIYVEKLHSVQDAYWHDILECELRWNSWWYTVVRFFFSYIAGKTDE